MKQTRKGNQGYLGMKIHIGTDRKGRVHEVTAAHAAAADTASPRRSTRPSWSD